MNIQFTVGTVNFTDYLHITAVRVRDNQLAWEDWFAMPVTSLVFQASGLTADNYRISFYDAATDADLGTLQASSDISGLSPQYQYELRFYDYDNLPGTATLSGGDKVLTDTYLAGKVIHAIDKVGFRLLDPANEYSYDQPNGEITLENGLQLFTGEKMCVIIQNNISSIVTPVASLFAGTVNITAQNYTISASDKNKRFRCVGSVNSQNITLPSLALISNDDFVFIDNTVGGLARQAKIILPGSDRILYNGWSLSPNQFAEFWVSRGETLRLQKYTSGGNEYWEVIGDYAGLHVGEKFYNTSRTHPNGLPNNNALITVDEFPRLVWWVKNVLTDKVQDDTINSGTWSRPAGKEGVFYHTSTYSHIRMPDTQNLSVRHLKSFTSFGSDTERTNDIPGGFQDEEIKEHGHLFFGSDGDDFPFPNAAGITEVATVNANGTDGNDNNTKLYLSSLTGGVETRPKNVGYIEYTRI